MIRNTAIETSLPESILRQATMNVSIPKASTTVSQQEMMSRGDWPLSLKVKEVARILNIGIHQAYDLVRSGEFPSRRVGSTIRIPRDPFFDWFEGAQTSQMA